MSKNRKTNIFEYNINEFQQKFEAQIIFAIENYWEENVAVKLCLINNFKSIRDEYFLKNTDFFSGQIRVERHKPVTVRLDSNFACAFLDNVFKNDNNSKFDLNLMTPLEIKVLNGFCEFLYKQIDEILINPKDISQTLHADNFYNLVFAVKLKDYPMSLLSVTVSSDRLNFDKIEHKISFYDEDFAFNNADVRIKIGQSKLTLEELNNLSVDDTILLEKSDISLMYLVSFEFEHPIRIDVPPQLITRIDNIEQNKADININEVKMNKNLWDDIQIELTAEFSKVKMTIGELKQITQGQVVDLGSIFGNEISLYIEDKKVAKGELLIINDKYAVKLNEVLNSNIKNANPQHDEKTPPKPQQANNKTTSNQVANSSQNPATNEQHAVVDEEEFDYSDFEN